MRQSRCFLAAGDAKFAACIAQPIIDRMEGQVQFAGAGFGVVTGNKTQGLFLLVA